jgi:hypothetical protein
MCKNPKNIAFIKGCVSLFVTYKLLIFKWIYDITFWLSCSNEKICEIIVKLFMGAGWVYRDGTKYLYLSRFCIDFESYRYRLALLMIANRILFGALRYSYLMKFIKKIRNNLDENIILEFQLHDCQDLSFAKIITKINDAVVEFKFINTGTNTESFVCTYPIEFNILKFPAEFQPPVSIEPQTLNLDELEAMIISTPLRNEDQDSVELRRRFIEPVV